MNPARISAFVILGIAAAAAAHVVVQQPSEAVAQTSPSDPLAKELDRCRLLDEKAENDRGCQAAYAKNRRQFFTPPAPYAAGKVELFPNNHLQTIGKTLAPATQEK